MVKSLSNSLSTPMPGDGEVDSASSAASDSSSSMASDDESSYASEESSTVASSEEESTVVSSSSEEEAEEESTVASDEEESTCSSSEESSAMTSVHCQSLGEKASHTQDASIVASSTDPTLIEKEEASDCSSTDKPSAVDSLGGTSEYTEESASVSSEDASNAVEIACWAHDSYTVSEMSTLEEPWRTATVANTTAGGDPEILEKQKRLLQQMQSDKDEWKGDFDQLLDEMKTLHSQMAQGSPGENELVEMQRAFRAFQKDAKNEIEMLHAELKAATSKPNTAKIPQDSDETALNELRREMAEIRKASEQEAKTLRDELMKARAESEATKESLEAALGLQPHTHNSSPLDKEATDSSAVSISNSLPPHPRTPKGASNQTKETISRQSPTSVLADLPMDLSFSSAKTVAVSNVGPLRVQASSRRRKKAPSLARPAIPFLAPHTIDSLGKAQRKDRDLQKMLARRGNNSAKTILPYTYSSMTIRECPGESGKKRQLVLFEHRLYVPATLRLSTLEYIKENHARGAMAILRQRFIWPNCVEELMHHVNSHAEF